IHANAFGLELVEGLQHRGPRRAEIDDSKPATWIAHIDLGLRHQAGRRLELPRDAVHVLRMDAPVLSVPGVIIVRGAASEKGALGRMRPRQRSIGDAIAIYIAVAAPVLRSLEAGR